LLGVVDPMSPANDGMAGVTMFDRVSPATFEKYCRDDTGSCSCAAYNPTALGTAPAVSYRQ